MNELCTCGHIYDDHMTGGRWCDNDNCTCVQFDGTGEEMETQ